MWSEIRGVLLTVEDFGSIFLNTSNKWLCSQKNTNTTAFCKVVTRHWENALLLFETFSEALTCVEGYKIKGLEKIIHSLLIIMGMIYLFGFFFCF